MSAPADFHTVDYAEAAAAALLPDATRLGAVHLTVNDLAESVPFYSSIVGLSELWRGKTNLGEDAVAMGGEGGEAVVVLVEDPAARPAQRTAGLYHVALRYPRVELSHVVRRISESKTSVQGASDHGTHEAIYLPDPDGNGLELAADRPREQWPSMGEELAQGGPSPLDISSLVHASANQSTRPRSVGVEVGHLHLHVSSIAQTEAFHRDVLGFSLVASLPTAIFMSAGGYHHHVGANTWRGPGSPPAPLGSIGLRHWSIVLPEADDLGALVERIERGGPEVVSTVDELGAVVLRDPSGNTVSVATEAQQAATPVGHQRPQLELRG